MSCSINHNATAIASLTPNTFTNIIDTLVTSLIICIL